MLLLQTCVGTFTRGLHFVLRSRTDNLSCKRVSYFCPWLRRSQLLSSDTNTKSTRNATATMPDFDPKDNVRNPDLQDLYDALDIHPDDQPVFDVFREELFDKLLDASEQQRRGGNADNHGSQSVTTDDTAAADFMIRRITYEIEEATDEDEEDKDEEDILVLARGSPPPNSWAKVKPGPEYGELHFPGHANYTDNEIPITGTPQAFPIFPPSYEASLR